MNGWIGDRRGAVRRALMRLLPLMAVATGAAFVSACDPIWLMEPSEELTGTVHEGAITTDETWRASDNPHRVVGRVVVAGPDGPTLTIEAGAEIRMGGDAELRIGSGTQPGSLQAVGSGSEPITFLSELRYRSPGYWHSLYFDKRAGPSRLEHVRIRDCGGSGEWPPSCLVMLGYDTGGPRPVLRDVQIASSRGYGVVAFSGGGFGEGSEDVRVLDTRNAPVRIGANEVHTLPAGLRLQDPDVGIEVPGGTVTESQTWPVQEGPYRISGDVYVEGPDAPVLQLEPGAELVFGRNRELVVGWDQPGGLLAEGTDGSRIVFTAGDATPGAWKGITLGPRVLASTRMRHTLVQYGGQANGYSKSNITFFADHGPILRDSEIRRSDGCGVARMRIDGEWETDWTDPAHGIVFSDNAFGPQCTQRN